MRAGLPRRQGRPQLCLLRAAHAAPLAAGGGRSLLRGPGWAPDAAAAARRTDGGGRGGNWAPWKLKKRVAQTLHRTLQRHGNPSASGGDSSAVAGGSAGEAAVAAQQAAKQALAAQKQAFARGFQDRWSARCLGGFLELVQLTREGSTTPLPPRVHNIALGYLDEAIKYKATYVSVLKPNLEALFSDVIYPPLCFSNDDAELWEDDPLEFVRRSFDIVEDFYSPRAGAQRLLVGLAEKRAKDCLHGFVVACSNILGTAAAAEAQGGVDDALLRRKDGALCAIAALERPLTKKDSPYRASLEGMLRQHVMPSLHSRCGFLRQRAASTYAAFASSVFKNAGKGRRAAAAAARRRRRRSSRRRSSRSTSSSRG